MKTYQKRFLFIFIILFAVIFSVIAFNIMANAADDDEVTANPSGAYLKYTVDVNKKDSQDNPNLAHNFMAIRKLDYVIQEGDMLEYDIYITVDEKGWGAIDGVLSGYGESIRDLGLSDTNGVGVHTGNDLSGYAFEQWYHRIIPFGLTEDESDKPTVGRTLKQIQLAMHPESSENDYQGIALYDNIVITNNGEVKFVIFKDESDFVPEEVKKVGTPLGSKGTIEMFVFTPEEEQAFKDAEEAKRIEEESREAARLEAEASKEASREQASIDASVAESEAANNTSPIDENNTAGAAENNNIEADGGSTMNISLVIIAAVGIPVLIVIVIFIVVSRKKGGR